MNFIGFVHKRQVVVFSPENLVAINSSKSTWLRYDVSKTLDAYQIDSALKLRKVSSVTVGLAKGVGGRNCSTVSFGGWMMKMCLVVCVFFVFCCFVMFVFLMGSTEIAGLRGQRR